MDGGLLPGAIFVDFRKAFDTIDLKILIDKLQFFSTCGNEHLWMLITSLTAPNLFS